MVLIRGCAVTFCDGTKLIGKIISLLRNYCTVHYLLNIKRYLNKLPQLIIMHKTLTMEQAKVKKRTLERGRHSCCLSFLARAQEQPQWSDRSAESMISRPPTCGNRNHPMGNNPWEWAKNKAIGHQKDIHNTTYIS